MTSEPADSITTNSGVSRRLSGPAVLAFSGLALLLSALTLFTTDSEERLADTREAAPPESSFVEMQDNDAGRPERSARPVQPLDKWTAPASPIWRRVDHAESFEDRLRNLPIFQGPIDNVKPIEDEMRRELGIERPVST
jgi:hypothetical protein